MIGTRSNRKRRTAMDASYIPVIRPPTGTVRRETFGAVRSCARTVPIRCRALCSEIFIPRVKDTNIPSIASCVRGCGSSMPDTCSSGSGLNHTMQEAATAATGASAVHKHTPQSIEHALSSASRTRGEQASRTLADGSSRSFLRSFLSLLSSVVQLAFIACRNVRISRAWRMEWCSSPTTSVSGHIGYQQLKGDLQQADTYLRSYRSRSICL